MLNLMDEEEIIPNRLSSKKITVYIISSYLDNRLSFRRFLRKGSRTGMKQQASFAGIYRDQKDDPHSINCIEYVNKKKKIVACCSNQYFFYDMKSNREVSEKEAFEKLDMKEESDQGNLEENPGMNARWEYEVRSNCGLRGQAPSNVENWLVVKFWKGWKIMCGDSLPVEISNHEGFMFRTKETFCGVYSGGFRSVSKNAEVYDSNLYFISGSDKELVGLNLKRDIDDKYNDLKKSFFSMNSTNRIQDSFKDEVLTTRIVKDFQVNVFSIWESFLIYGNREGLVREVHLEKISHSLDSLVSAKKTEESNFVSFKGGDLTCLQYFHWNIIGGTFDTRNYTAKLHLFNTRRLVLSELLIEKALKPIHKISMFIRNGFKFGIALNRGYDMHVFGIHDRKIHMFRSRVKIASEYISGMLFIQGEKDTVLIYGDKNYNMKFKITV